MLHFRPRCCNVATCGWANPITEAPLLVLGRPPQELVDRREGRFSFPAARKAFPSGGYHTKPQEGCYVVGAD